MPQMMPLNWLMLMMFFVSIFFMFSNMNYYIFNYKTQTKFSNKNTLMLNWKW